MPLSKLNTEKKPVEKKQDTKKKRPKEPIPIMREKMKSAKKKIKLLRKRHMEIFFILQAEENPPLPQSEVTALEKESAVLEKALNEEISNFWHYRFAIRNKYLKVLTVIAIFIWLFEHFA